MARVILHVDLDAFFAQAEELRKPGLKGKPVVVCVYSGRGEDGGAVGTANYEARKLGIHSGLPIAFAKRKATPETIFLKVDIPYYKELSEDVMEVLQAKADAFEQVSIDEAYLDVSESCGSVSAGEKLAKRLKAEIGDKTGLTCSVGVASNKLLAKTASGYKKPAGLTVIQPGKEKQFLAPLPVRKLMGVGKKAEEILLQMNIQTIGGLASRSESELVEAFGKARGRMLHRFANGIDDSPVEEGERQQLSRIGTLKKDSNQYAELKPFLDALVDDLFARAKKDGRPFRAVSLLLVTDRLKTLSRSKTLERAAQDAETLRETAQALLRQFLAESDAVMLRRLGVRVTELQGEDAQRSLSEFA